MEIVTDAMSSDNLLISYIEKGHNRAAKSLLINYRYINKWTGDFGQTLLHFAAKHGNLEILSYLIACGCKVNAQDKFGTTPLMLAITEARDPVLVKTLLEANADINLKDFKKSSALRKIIKMSLAELETLHPYTFQVTRTFDILKMLMSEMENKFAYDKEQVVNDFIEAHCPLGLVIFMRNAIVTEYLLDNGYFLNELVRNWSTLHIAVLMADMRNVEILLDFGADVNDLDSMSQTPLFLYNLDDDVKQEKHDILKYLLEKGASLTIPRYDGITLMQYFFAGARVNTLLAVTQSKTPQLLKRTIDGKTPLHFWVDNIFDNTDIALKYLPIKQIDVDAVDNEGVSPLVKAVRAGLLNKVIVLIKLGAKVHFSDIFDKTNLFDKLISTVGCDLKYAKIAEYLLHRQTFKFTYHSDHWPLLLVVYKDKNYLLTKELIKYLAISEVMHENVPTHAKIRSNNELKTFYELCILQLKYMRRTVVCESITLYHLLTNSEEQITLYARNSSFQARAQQALIKFYEQDSFYFYDIQQRVERAIKEAKLRKDACCVLYNLMQMRLNASDPIFYNIVKYMSKKDKYVLKKV